MISAGEMTRRITIRGSTTATDAGGGRVVTPTVVVSRHPAKVEPLEGSELVEAMQIGMQRPHRFTIRYRTGLTGATEILYDDRRFDVRSVVDPDEAHREIVLIADEIVIL